MASLEPWIEKQREKYVVRWRDASGKKYSDKYRFDTATDAKARRNLIVKQLINQSIGRQNIYHSAEKCVESFLENMYQIGSTRADTMKCALNLFLLLKDNQNNLVIRTMSDIKRVRILEFLGTLQNKYSQHTVQTYMGILRKWLGWAVDHEYLETLPYKDIRVPTPKKIERYLTDGEVIALEQAIDNEEYRCIFRLGYCCGLRPGEIRRIKSSDILWNHVQNKVELSIPRDETKTDTGGRIVGLPPGVYDLLPKGDKPFERWTENSMDNYFTKIKDFAKLEDKFIRGKKVLKTFYWTRHTFARRYLENGGRLKKLSYLMGHTSIQMTADVYGHMERSLMGDPNMPAILKIMREEMEPVGHQQGKNDDSELSQHD